MEETSIDDNFEEDDWIRCYSQSKQREYWFNQRNGISFWCNDSIIKNLNEIDDKVAIIVPFRDNHPDQKRQEQLNKFIPEITKFLLMAEIPFKIFIIEQSNDQRKFNRGKLLNIGYVLAAVLGYTIFVLHDVDLIPSPELLQYYTVKPRSSPVHVARVWNRYNGNAKYFGGIVTFSKELYEEINGYPNNFWGWGGEDDELYKRVETMQLNVTSPLRGSIYDMEEMDLTTKLNFLKEHELLKCMNRKEILDEHRATWRTNGISSFRTGRPQFRIISKTFVGNDFCVKYTVELFLNGNHWTDGRAGENDRQY